MTSEQYQAVTGKQIKSDAKAVLSDRNTLLKLIFCGFFYIAVLVLFKLFSSYLFQAMVYNVTDELKLKNYSLLFTAVSDIPAFLLIFPLFMGVFHVAAKLSNESPVTIVEILEYYSSFKKISKAWAVGSIIQLPFVLANILQALLRFLSHESLILRAILPGVNLILIAVCSFLTVFISGKFFTLINSVVCGGDQPVYICLKASLKATRDKMWRLFAFRLSFIPWILLSALTVGVLFIIFTFPYILISECLYSKYLLTGKYRIINQEETL